jgi:hypothetical protein
MTTCGGAGHSEECLCDVVITEVTPTNYHFDQVWHAGIVARATGYKRQGGASLAAFLESLSYAYDATRRLADTDGDWLDDVGTSGANLKAKVEAYLQDGHSILDVPDLVVDSFDRIVAAITGCQPCLIWTWDNRQWLAFESYLTTKHTHSQSDLAERFGLTRPQCTNLVKLYGKGLEGEAHLARAARAAELFDGHQDKGAPEILQMLLDEGHEYTLDGVRKARQRWRFRRSGVYAAAAAAATISLTLMAKIMAIMEHMPQSGMH